MAQANNGTRNRGSHSLLLDEGTFSGTYEQARIQAISRVLASEANRDGDVQRFRQSTLKNTLLALNDVPQWIDKQAEREGLPSRWLTGVAVNQEDIREEKVGNKTEFVSVGPFRFQPKDEASDLSDDIPSLNYHYLGYATSDGLVTSKAVRAGGILAELRSLSRALSVAFPWSAAQATTFVLTGLVPLVNEKVKGLVQEKTQHVREMSQKHMMLAVFTAEHDGDPLTMRMRVWNGAHPEWAYKRVTNFGWDSQQAVRRLVGMDLNTLGSVLVERRLFGDESKLDAYTATSEAVALLEAWMKLETYKYEQEQQRRSMEGE